MMEKVAETPQSSTVLAVSATGSMTAFLK